MPVPVTAAQPPADHGTPTVADPMAPATKLTVINAVLTRLRPSGDEHVTDAQYGQQPA